MTFTPSIQALIGTHTQQASGNVQCGVDWVRNNAFIIGIQGGTNYLSSVGLITGTEQAFQDTTSYTPALNGSRPVGVDGLGNVYTTWSGLFGGGLSQFDGTTLAQLASGGSNASEPNGWILSGGTLSNVISGTAQFMLGTQIGSSSVGSIRNTVVYNQVTFAGRGQNYVNAGAMSCAGKTGSGLGFILASPISSSDTQTLLLDVISCTPGGTWTIADWPTQNPLVTVATVDTILPTDIDATWTQIYGNGICVDQVDGNVIISCQGQIGATTPGYIVKLDSTSGAVIWQVALPNSTAIGLQQFAFANITNQRLCFVTGSPTTVTTINTSDGSTSAYTTGLAGLTIYGQQCFNDQLGAILCNVTFANTAGSPTKLNSTPDNYTGWSMLYVAQPPAPPPGNRRFLAECGPIRTGSGSSTSPIIPPTPPPPTPPPAVVTNIITLSGDTLITLSGSNIITDT